MPPRAWARVPPQRPAAERPAVCPRPFRSGPGRLPRPAWPAVWWLSGCPGLAFGGPPSRLRRPCAAAASLGLLPAGPWRRRGLSPGPPRLRARHLRPRAPALARAAQGGGGGRPRSPAAWPVRCGSRPVLPVSARVRPPSALLGRVPLPPPLSGPPPTALGARRHSCGGRRRGAAAGRNPARFWRRRRPPPLPPLVGLRPLPGCAAALAKSVEKCRILPYPKICCKMEPRACPRGRTLCDTTKRWGISWTYAANYKPSRWR